MSNTKWKNEAGDLRALARSVYDQPADQVRMSPRAAAAIMLGIVRMVVERFGQDVMQRSCADLARHQLAWSSKMGALPRDDSGRTPEPILLLAAAARGIATVAGTEAARAAVAFWACEDDSLVLMKVADHRPSLSRAVGY